MRDPLTLTPADCRRFFVGNFPHRFDHGFQREIERVLATIHVASKMAKGPAPIPHAQKTALQSLAQNLEGDRHIEDIYGHACAVLIAYYIGAPNSAFRQVADLRDGIAAINALDVSEGNIRRHEELMIWLPTLLLNPAALD